MESLEGAVPTEQEVLEAVAGIVAAFAAMDTTDYFARFASNASFVFHAEPRRLNSRRDYEELWNQWVADGWRVVACESSNPLVTTFSGGAIFAHDVATTVQTGKDQESYRERETIVFRHTADGRLAAIHEHLSPSPATSL